jgi:hypothetical protein
LTGRTELLTDGTELLTGRADIPVCRLAGNACSTAPATYLGWSIGPNEATLVQRPAKLAALSCARGTFSRVTLPVAEGLSRLSFASRDGEKFPCFHGISLNISLTNFCDLA